MAGEGEAVNPAPAQAAETPAAGLPVRTLSPAKIGAAVGASERAVQLWCRNREKFPDACPHSMGGTGGKRMYLNLEEVKEWMARTGLDAKLRKGGDGEGGGGGGGDGKAPPLMLGGGAGADGGLFDPKLQTQSPADLVKSIQAEIQSTLSVLRGRAHSQQQYRALVDALKELTQAQHRTEDRIREEEERKRVVVPRAKASRLQAELGRLVQSQVMNLVLTVPPAVREACRGAGMDVAGGQADAFDRVASGSVREKVQGVLAEIAAGVERLAGDLERMELGAAA